MVLALPWAQELTANQKNMFPNNTRAVIIDDLKMVPSNMFPRKQQPAQGRKLVLVFFELQPSTPSSRKRSSNATARAGRTTTGCVFPSPLVIPRAHLLWFPRSAALKLLERSVEIQRCPRRACVSLTPHYILIRKLSLLFFQLNSLVVVSYKMTECSEGRH